MSWSRLLMVIVLVSATQGLLLIGPKIIRSNHNYSLWITNHNTTKLHLKVRMKGVAIDGRTTLNIAKSVTAIPNANAVVNFGMPSLSPAVYEITIDGERETIFHKSKELIFVSKSVSALIQIDKPVFNPGDTAQFRAIVLDTELKPPAGLKTVQVTVQDPLGNVIRKWPSASLNVGVFEGKVEIAPSPLLGPYNIIVKSGDEELATKTFEVQEYVLSSFDVEVFPATVPLQAHSGLILTIVAKNIFGKAVTGTIDLTVFSPEQLTLAKATWAVNGKLTHKLSFEEELDVYEHSEDVDVKFTFTETYTNRTLTKSLKITVFKNKYRATLIKETPTFLPGLSFAVRVKVTHQDGVPAKNVDCHLTVEGVANGRIDKHSPTDENGEIKELLQTRNETIYVDVSIGGHEILNEEINPNERIGRGFIELKFDARIQLNEPMQILVKLKKKVPSLFYYVLSKGNIVSAGFERPGSENVNLRVKATYKMLPWAHILVATIFNGRVEYAISDIKFDVLTNQFAMEIDEGEIKPGGQIELRMTGHPGSYVALSAYDKRLRRYSSTQDLDWNGVLNLFHSVLGNPSNAISLIESIGLLAIVSDDLELDEADSTYSRRRNGAFKTHTSHDVVFRTNFAESFLWKNVNIERNGELTLIETAPDSITSWYLTGFSIDQKFGLGIIKKPIELSTTQSFYIVDHLPYSIKRGEAVELQFTIFSNLGRSYINTVTLYNDQEQMEFLEESSSLTEQEKTIVVEEAVGVPVSFLVKAKKLGEMAVCVKATNMLDSDAFERIIRVMPESLVEKRMESRVFNHNHHTNSTFSVELNIPQAADSGSPKITFKLSKNILSSVIPNLGNLLSVPTGCGEQNMIRFVPNIIVLDFLRSTESEDDELIVQATNLLRQGYQNQLKYQQKDGSFGVWKNDRGSVFLTAFVAKSMHTAAKYITEVDANMVEKAFDWLASKQHYSGRFDEVGPIIHNDMQGGLRNGITLTSYVLIAFLENENARETHSVVVKKAMTYVGDRMRSVYDVYDLSIATYALMLGKYRTKDTWYNKLMSKSTIKNEGNEKYWARSSLSVETTAYAMLSMVMAEKYGDGYPVMRWLVNKRYVTGAFSRTQDTFVGLKALTKLSDALSQTEINYRVELKYENGRKNYIITSEDSNEQDTDLPNDIRNMEINVQGIGFGLLEVKYEYNLDLRNYSHRFDLSVEKLNTNSDYELKLKICASFIPKLANERSNMALVEVNFPSGYVVDAEPISEMSPVNPIQKTEIRFGGTSVVLYYNNMGMGRNCFTITAYRRFKVTLKRPAFVLVHDYYDPGLNAMQVYEVDV